MHNYWLKFKSYLLIVVVSITIGGVSAIAWNRHATPKNYLPEEFLKPRTDVNKPFPDLGITRYSSSERLVDYLSNKKVLLIVFSASCIACKNEIDHLKTANMLRDTGIEIVIVGIDEESSLRQVLNNYDIDVPIFDDRTSKIRDAFDLKVTPTNFLIDKGEIDRIWNGSPTSSTDLINKLGLSAK
jgi:peroxiredoxin